MPNAMRQQTNTTARVTEILSLLRICLWMFDIVETSRRNCEISDDYQRQVHPEKQERTTEDAGMKRLFPDANAPSPKS